MASINDEIVAALSPDYEIADDNGTPNVTDLLRRWMLDVGIPLWNTDALRSYLLDETTADPSLSTNDLLLLYFSGAFDTGGFLMLTTGDHLLLTTDDFLLLAES